MCLDCVNFYLRKIFDHLFSLKVLNLSKCGYINELNNFNYNQIIKSLVEIRQFKFVKVKNPDCHVNRSFLFPVRRHLFYFHFCVLCLKDRKIIITFFFSSLPLSHVSFPLGTSNSSLISHKHIHTFSKFSLIHVQNQCKVSHRIFSSLIRKSALVV